MDKEKITDKIDQAGHAVDDFVEEKSAKHGFTKFQVWVGLAVLAIAAVAIIKWVL